MQKERQFVHLDIRTERTPGAFGKPSEYIRRAKAFHSDAAGVADTTISSWVKWDKACEEEGVKPIFGYETTFNSEIDARKKRVTLLVRNEKGFTNLTRLSEKKQPLDIHDLAEHRDGLLVIAPEFSVEPLREVLDKKQLFIEAVDHLDQPSHDRLSESLQSSEQWKIPAVASNRTWRPEPKSYDVFLSAMLQAQSQKLHLPRNFLNRQTFELIRDNHGAYEMLTHRFAGDMLGFSLPSFHPEGWMKSPAVMQPIFEKRKGVIARTAEIAEACKPQHLPPLTLPKYLLREGENITDVLHDRCYAGLLRRYGKLTKAIREQADHELEVIGNRNFENQYLIAEDIIKFTRDQEIEIHGLGSATGSLVCYALGITDVDPLSNGLLFERFIPPEGTNRRPDIDFLVDADGMKPLYDHLAKKYPGQQIYPHRIVEYPTYNMRGAVRALLRIFQYSDAEISTIQNRLFREQPLPQSVIPAIEMAEELTKREHPKGIIQTHPSKVVFTAKPIEKGYAVHTDREIPLLEIEKERAESTINIDLLSSNPLRLINHILKRLQIDKSQLPRNDVMTLAEVFQGHTIGVPYLESDWLQEVLLKYGIAAKDLPKSEHDLTNAFTLSRPGVSQSIPTYLDRLSGRMRVRYTNQNVKEILGDTYGVLLFQEQAMKLAVQCANFSPAEAEKLRRSMSKERTPDLMQSLRSRFIEGALENGISKTEAIEIFSHIANLVHYSFLKGHAITMMQEIGYPAAYLKQHFPEIYFSELFALQTSLYFLIGQGDIYRQEARRLRLPGY